jgi:hypothetical protein
MEEKKPGLWKPFAKTLMLTVATKALRGNTAGVEDGANIQTKMMRRVAETLEARAPVFHDEYQDQRRQAEGKGLVGKIRNAILDAVLDGVGSAPRQDASVPKMGSMTRAEALDILDLKEGATREEIERKFTKIIRQNHPDLGGSTFLAKQLIGARETLLGKTRV